MKQAIRLLLVGHFGARNVGDDAMLLGIMRGIRELLPTARVRVMSTSRTPATDSSATDNFPTIVGRGCRSVWRNLSWCDAVILGGGTHIHDFLGHQRYARILAGYSLLFALAKLMRKRIAHLGVGIGPLDTWWGKRLGRYSLALADVIAVRDQCSLEEVEQLGLKTRALKGFDASVLVRPSSLASGAGRRMVLGCSVLPYHRIYEGVPHDDDMAVDALAESITIWLRESPARRVKVFVFRGPSKDDDCEVAQRLVNCLRKHGRATLVPYSPDAQHVMNEVEGCDYFIAARFHSIVFAYMARLPMIVVSYHPKCRHIASDIGLPDTAVLPIEECANPTTMTGHLQALTNRPEAFEPSLPVEDAVARARTMFQALAELIQEEPVE